MEIVIEYVFFENLIINYLIFSCTGSLFKIKPKFCLFSSIFGAIMSLLFPLFFFPLYVHILATILTGIIMVCISFPINSFKQFCFHAFGFLFLTFVFGGANYMIRSWFGPLSEFIICIISFVVFMLIKAFLKHLNKKRALNNFTCSVQIECKGRVTEEIGYIDSANMLYDPITSSPIVLISKEVFEKVTGEDCLYYLLKKEKIKELPCGHLINVGSAVSKGRMIVFQADRMTITEKGRPRTYSKQLLGLSMADFSKALNSGVLIHGELA